MKLADPPNPVTYDVFCDTYNTHYTSTSLHLHIHTLLCLQNRHHLSSPRPHGDKSLQTTLSHPFAFTSRTKQKTNTALGSEYPRKEFNFPTWTSKRTSRICGPVTSSCKPSAKMSFLNPGQTDSQVNASFQLASNLRFVWTPTCIDLRRLALTRVELKFARKSTHFFTV